MRYAILILLAGLLTVGAALAEDRFTLPSGRWTNGHGAGLLKVTVSGNSMQCETEDVRISGSVNVTTAVNGEFHGVWTVDGVQAVHQGAPTDLDNTELHPGDPVPFVLRQEGHGGIHLTLFDAKQSQILSRELQR